MTNNVIFFHIATIGNYGKHVGMWKANNNFYKSRYSEKLYENKSDPQIKIKNQLWDI